MRNACEDRMSGDLLDSNLSTVIAKRGSDQPKDIVASYDAHCGFNLATAFIPSNLEAWVKVEAFWRVTIMELDDGLDYGDTIRSVPSALLFLLCTSYMIDGQWNEGANEMSSDYPASVGERGGDTRGYIATHIY